MSVVSISSGRQFVTDGAQTLLDAAGVAGITLPHSCRTGRCSSCKAHVRVGRTRALRDELGLNAAERDAGWVLTCVRAALSDVELDIEDLGDTPVFAAKTLPARIHSLDRLAPDVMRVLLRLPPTAAFQFHPGQYIEVIGPAGIRRSYSLAQAADRAAPLELHIRQVGGGALSRYWFEQAQSKDLVRLKGPLGTFFLRDVLDQDVVFLATGTGIAPVKAMVEGLLNSGAVATPRSVSIYWGGRTQSDLYWQPDWRSERITFIPVLSRAEPAWAGARGHVQQMMLEQSAGRDWSRTRVYACGSDAMIHSARQALIQAGLSERHFHADAFVSSAGD